MKYVNVGSLRSDMKLLSYFATKEHFICVIYNLNLLAVIKLSCLLIQPV